jgi:CheY-like chemotaxis protein
MGEFELPPEGLEDELLDTLKHLYDPDYRPGPRMFALAGSDPEAGLLPLQGAILQALATLKPAEGEAGDARARLLYELLQQRYVLRLTQEDVADALHISVRHVNRLQREAAYALARALWQGRQPTRPPARIAPGAGGRPDSGPGLWSSQVRLELEALSRESGEARAEVATALEGALRIAGALSRDGAVSFEIRELEPGLVAAIHPAALRQALLAIAHALLRVLPAGVVIWRVRRADERIQVTATATLGVGIQLDLGLAQELASAYGGTAYAAANDGQVSAVLDLPAEIPAGRRAVVLAIDDNPDLIALFASYCEGTPFEFVHVREGRRAFEAIEAHRPDVLLLDVMLPDLDGWDLLLDLRADARTRGLPVVVCSVVTDEALALTLGAVAYLRKPVWRQQLLDALTQALNRAGR